MSWGYKIAAVYIGFVALILTLVGMAMSQRLDLVADNYYQQELEFQHKIDAREAARNLAEPLTWNIANNVVEVSFPSQFKGMAIEGTVYFFRASDARQDRKFAIKTDDFLKQTISTEGFAKGQYRLQIDWKVNSKAYYNEGIIEL